MKWLQLEDEVLGTYNCWDTYTTARLIEPVRAELADQGLLEWFDSTYWPLVQAVMAMAKRGMEIDKSALREYRKKLLAELNEVDGQLREHYKATCDLSDVLGDLAWRVFQTLTGGRRRKRSLYTKAEWARVHSRLHLNIDSRDQVAKWLYQDLGLKHKKLTASGKRPAVDLEALDWTLRNLRKRDESHRWVIETLFHRSRLDTIRDRYLKIQVDKDGRVRPSIKMYGAETGRLAYAHPPLQQWPPEARHVFIARPGHVFLAVDYSQLEARILAILSGDRASLDVFAAGGDVHASNAMDLFGLSSVDWEALDPVRRKASRNFAKAFLYGISYGGAAETMKTKLYCPCPKCQDKVPPTLELSRAELKTASQRWFYIHRPVVQWREQLVRKVFGPHGTRFYRSPMGRGRYFLAPYRDSVRELYNCPMQMLASEIVDRATGDCHEAGVPLVLQMHDELMAEVPEGEVSHWRKVMQDLMEKPVPELDGAVFPTDAEVGPTWGDLKELPPRN